MKEEFAFYFTEKGEYAPREGLPFKQRKNIAAVIKHGTQYLFLEWKETNYNNSLVTGGIDEGENPLEAVKREVIEETGYYDIESISPLDCINVSRFYVEHKNENREAIYYPYLVVLNSLNRSDISDYEKKEHSCFWVSEEKLEEVPLFENHRKMLSEVLENKASFKMMPKKDQQ